MVGIWRKTLSKQKKSIPVWKVWAIVILACVLYAIVQVARESFNENAIVGEIKESSLPVLGDVGEFSFTEKNGSVMTRDSFRGKVWVFDLFFTSCEGPCPLMSHHMSALQRVFLRNDKVQFVSLTIDPETDTPEVLKKYAKSYKAKDGKWFFLRGNQDSVVSFAKNALKLPADKMGLMHSPRFVLVDTKGQIRGYFDSQDKNEMEKLKARIKTL